KHHHAAGGGGLLGDPSLVAEGGGKGAALDVVGGEAVGVLLGPGGGLVGFGVGGGEGDVDHLTGLELVGDRLGAVGLFDGLGGELGLLHWGRGGLGGGFLHEVLHAGLNGAGDDIGVAEVARAIDEIEVGVLIDVEGLAESVPGVMGDKEL